MSVEESMKHLNELVRSEAFQSKCEEFLQGHCGEFSSGVEVEENKLEWTKIHADYESLVETELSKAVTEAELAAVCEDLPNLIDNASDVETTETIDLLTSFTDYEHFKKMMLSRFGEKALEQVDAAVISDGDKSLQNNEGTAYVLELIGAGEANYEMTKQADWKLVTQNDKSGFMSFQRTDPTTGAGYLKSVIQVDLPVKDHVALWCRVDSEREKFDHNQLFGDITIIEDRSAVKGDWSNQDIIATLTLYSMPKLMRWALGIDKAPYRFVTKSVDDNGTTVYVTVMWDVENDCKSKKFDFVETGCIKPHPDDPNKSYLMSVVDCKKWVPTVVMGKIAESIYTGMNLPLLVDNYKKAMMNSS